jgi:hypothetical protein
MTTPQLLRRGQALFGFCFAVGNIILLIGEIDVAKIDMFSRQALGYYVGCGLGLWILVGAARSRTEDYELSPEADASSRWSSGVVGAAVLGACVWFAIVKFPTFGKNVYAAVTVILWLCGVGFGFYYLSWAISPPFWEDQPAPPPLAEEPPELPSTKPWHRRTGQQPQEPGPDELDDSP